MGRIIKLLVLVVVLAGAGLVGFAYLGDLSPDQTVRNEPVVIEVE